MQTLDCFRFNQTRFEVHCTSTASTQVATAARHHGDHGLLVRGASRLSLSLGISPLVVGLTVVAFGTSAPELAVSVQGAMNGQGARAGSASALLGCMQFSVAAGASALVGVLHDGTAVPMSTVISLCGLLVVCVALLTRRLQNARALAQAQAEA